MTMQINPVPASAPMTHCSSFQETFTSIMRALGGVVILCGLFAHTVGGGAEAAPSGIPLGNQFRVKLSEAVVVAMADPAERRWGQYQFVTLSAYPGEKLLLRFHTGEDSVRAYGRAQPAFLSSNQGRSWQPSPDPSSPHASLVADIFSGQYLCMPIPKPLDVRALNIEMPKPVGEYFCYRKMLIYRAEQFPAKVRDFLHRQPCYRWNPSNGKWLPDETAIDMRGRLVWIAQGTEAGLVSGVTFERPPLRVGSELLWADYRALFAMPDGSAPKGCGISCLVSTNNGKSWQFRAPIANADAIPGEISNMTEPVLSLNSKGELVCVMRRTDQEQKSMLITTSRDQGRTWDTPRAMDELGKFGVMPDLLRLESGPLILAFGRPGVNLTVSLDGSGKTWEPPISLLPCEPKNLVVRTDGYTALRAVSASEFLLAYADFERLDEQGRKRKAVLVRRLSLERN